MNSSKAASGGKVCGLCWLIHYTAVRVGVGSRNQIYRPAVSDKTRCLFKDAGVEQVSERDRPVYRSRDGL